MNLGRSPNYLVHNSHSFCFRMRVPEDLRRYFGKKELKYSLKTGYIRTAKNKARYLAGFIQVIFERLRSGGYKSSYVHPWKTRYQSLGFWQRHRISSARWKCACPGSKG